MTTVDLSWKLRAQKAESEAKAMREALVKYGAHFAGCGRNDPYDTLQLPCTCGFESALAAAQANTKGKVK